jgi:hypothetical protein
MTIRDRYLLRRSNEFYLAPGQEASVNLALMKAPALPCTTLCGRVKGSCGPIAGATVKVLDRCFRPLCHAETDSGGYFSIADTLMSGEYEVIAAADGYLVSESRLISLKPSCPLYLTIQLFPDRSAGLGTVYGTVRDEKNAPLAGVQIAVFRPGAADDPKAVAVSGPDGEYLVCGLEPGEYRISAFLHGYHFPDEIALRLFPREIECADLYLYREESSCLGTVSGTVRYQGKTVSFAEIALYRVEGERRDLIRIRNANGRGEISLRRT